MGRPGRGLECPACSTYTSGHRGETNNPWKTQEIPPTSNTFGDATNRSESIGTYALDYLVFVYPQYLGTQPLRLLDLDFVRALGEGGIEKGLNFVEKENLYDA